MLLQPRLALTFMFGLAIAVELILAKIYGHQLARVALVQGHHSKAVETLNFPAVISLSLFLR